MFAKTFLPLALLSALMCACAVSGPTPNPLTPLQQQAIDLHRQGDYPAEEQILLQALALDSENPGLNYALALLRFPTSPHETIPLLERAALAPDSPAPGLIQALKENETAPRAAQLTAAGQALAGLGEWALAQTAFENAVTANPRYPPAWAWLGQARQVTGHGDPWIAFREAIRLGPDLPLVWALRGLALQRAGFFDEALSDLEQAITLEPQTLAWRWARAEIFLAKDDINAALLAYQQAADLDVTDPRGWNQLALFCLNRDMLAREIAYPAALQAYRLDPKNPAYVTLLGRALLATRDYKQAERILLSAVELAPADPAPHFYLGLLYIENKNVPQAELHLLKAEQLDPQGALGRQARQVYDRYLSGAP